MIDSLCLKNFQNEDWVSRHTESDFRDITLHRDEAMLILRAGTNHPDNAGYRTREIRCEIGLEPRAGETGRKFRQLTLIKPIEVGAFEKSLINLQEYAAQLKDAILEAVYLSSV